MKPVPRQKAPRAAYPQAPKQKDRRQFLNDLGLAAGSAGGDF